MIDLHCHIMPYVDDGASDLMEATELLKMEAEQGVTHICLTPHLRSGMFGTTDEKVVSGYKRLGDVVRDNQIPVKVYLGREYYYDSAFLKLLAAGHVLPIGRNGTLLVEFSYGAEAKTLLDAAQNVLNAGYYPLFAHVERYEAAQGDFGVVRELINMGAMIQVNAPSLVGKESWGIRRTARGLIRDGLVHVVASDAHNTYSRPLLMGKCGAFMEKKFGRETAQTLLERNPLAILLDSAEEDTNAES